MSKTASASAKTAQQESKETTRGSESPDKPQQNGSALEKQKDDPLPEKGPQEPIQDETVDENEEERKDKIKETPETVDENEEEAKEEPQKTPESKKAKDGQKSNLCSMQ